jgi:hypothetical protein
MVSAEIEITRRQLSVVSGILFGLVPVRPRRRCQGNHLESIHSPAHLLRTTKPVNDAMTRTCFPCRDGWYYSTLWLTATVTLPFSPHLWGT